MSQRAGAPTTGPMAGIQLTGLASGLDTATIIDRLMTVERGPRTRMTLQQAALQARQRTLGDISAKLKSLNETLQRLSSVTTWQEVQTVSSSDSGRVGARQSSGAAPGGYAVSVTQLATSDQHVYAYTPQAAGDTLAIGNGTVDLAPNATLDDVIGAVNGDPALGVIALGVDFSGAGERSLVLVARATGTAAAFAATGASLAEDGARARPARDAEFTIDGGATRRSSTNVVTNAIPGVELTLSGTPATATVMVGVPVVDRAAVTAAVQALASSYNTAVDALRAAVAERPVAGARTSADAAKGSLYADPALKSLLDALRTAIGRPADAGGPRLADAGISTGAATGSAPSADALAGKLTIDAAALASALDRDPASVRRLLTGDDGGGGLARAWQDTLRPHASTGGSLDARIDAAGTANRALSARIDDFDGRLSRRESLLRRQFTAMETALQRARSQGDDLAVRLGLNRDR